MGNLKDVQNGVAIILGTGVGGGIILNGEINQGSRFQAGELSFMIQNQKLNSFKDLTEFSHSAVEFIKSACQFRSKANLLGAVY